ncbi:MAG: hypothetical protein O3B74_10605 [Proteobacteria bacterium]|nr:hypothetical protein [Pseudomonadota bacterium]MDA1308294.1 hypothetical protein [Pseudomonadota bacterium]
MSYFLNSTVTPRQKRDGRGACAPKLVPSYRVNLQSVLTVSEDDFDDETVLRVIARRKSALEYC